MTRIFTPEDVNHREPPTDGFHGTELSHSYAAIGALVNDTCKYAVRFNNTLRKNTLTTEGDLLATKIKARCDKVGQLNSSFQSHISENFDAASMGLVYADANEAESNKGRMRPAIAMREALLDDETRKKYTEEATAILKELQAINDLAFAFKKSEKPEDNIASALGDFMRSHKQMNDAMYELSQQQKNSRHPRPTSYVEQTVLARMLSDQHTDDPPKGDGPSRGGSGGKSSGRAA